MKSFKLPKKNKFKNYLKLFFTLNLLFGLGALGLFFYFSYEKNNPLLSALSPFFSRPTDSEVLSISAGPQPLVRITKYDFNPRPANNTATSSGIRDLDNGYGGIEFGGVDNGRVFPLNCSQERGSFNSNDSQGCLLPFQSPASPPVIRTWGIGSNQKPVLFYYGGMYEVKRNSNRVQLISRLYSSNNPDAEYNVCNRNWFPQVVERDRGNDYYFGHSALVEDSSQGECRSMVRGGRLQEYREPQFDRWPYHFQYKVRLKTDNNGDLAIDKVWSYYMQSVQSYGINWDYSNPNHKNVCLGKDINGTCFIVQTYKEWTGTGDRNMHWSMLSEGNEGNGQYLGGFGDLGFRAMRKNVSSNAPIYYLQGVPSSIMCNDGSESGAFTSSLLGGRRLPWYDNTACKSYYTGFDVPALYFQANYFANSLSGSFSFTQPYPALNNQSSVASVRYRSPNPEVCRNDPFGWNGNCSTWRGFNTGAFPTSALEMANFRLFQFDNGMIYNDPSALGTWPLATYNSELRNPSNVKADYASDAYFFKLNYINGRISVYRFGLSEIPFNQNGNASFPNNTGLSQLDITGNLETKNISFNVNGRGDLDILFAPLPSAVNGNSRARIFRVPNFNNVNPNIAEAIRPVMYEMTDTANGYAFTSSRATGEESPLSFEYVNVADGNLTNDYAVFATKNSVWTANIPYGCTMNNVTATFLTNPNSRLNGVVVPTNGNSYNLSFSISPAPVITCGGTNLPIAGYTLQLIDPLSSNTTPTRNLTSVGNLLNPSFSNNFDTAVRRKWNLKLFAYTSSNTSIQIPIRGPDINGNFSYIEEGRYQLRVFKDIGNGLTAPHNGAVFSIAQTFVQLPNELSISKPIRGVSLAPTSNTAILNSSFISGYFSDHRLFSAPISRLNDLVSTQITFIPQNAYQSDSRNFLISRISVSPNPSNFVITRGGSSPSLPSPRSFSFSYTSSGTVYTLPSNSVITVVLSNVDAPPASVVTTDLRNVSFNSNVVNLKTENIKGETYPSSSLKSREGNYLYSITDSSSFTKKLKLSNSSIFFNFPIRYTIPSSRVAFKSINPSNCSSSSFDLLNIFNSNQDCSIGSSTTTFSGPNLKILFVNNGTIKVDLNASLPSQLPIIRNTYLIDNNSSSTPKISFALNCDTNPTPFLCLSGNRYFVSGGLYRNVKFDGKLQSSQQNDIKMTVSQTGDVLPTLQHHLHRNKIPEIAIRKVILKYK